MTHPVLTEEQLVLTVIPVGKPRQTRSTFSGGKKRPAIARYHDYRDEVRRQAKLWMPPYEGLYMTFILPMPKSWSQKKRDACRGMAHQQTPDLDNLVKAFLDCFGEDCQVWHFESRKLWGIEGKIILRSIPGFPSPRGGW